MSARKLYRIKYATDRFNATRDVLVAELDRGGAPRALLLAAVELCECYVECTGGTLVTAKMRAELLQLRARVEDEPVLRAMEPTGPATYWPADSDWQREVERKRTAHFELRETPEGMLYAPPANWGVCDAMCPASADPLDPCSCGASVERAAEGQ